MQKDTLDERSYSQHIPSLDLCRGLAAMVVMLLHMDFLFFGIDSNSHKLFPRGYLCVDFFFLLSGYVIANSYDWKFSNGLSARAFVGVRIARLWPLVVVTCFAGFLLALVRSFLLEGSFKPDSAMMFDLMLNLAILPALSAGAVFPFNPAAWSIFFEFVINIFYAALYRVMHIGILAAAIALALIGLVVSAVANNTLDVGWSLSNMVFAWPRVFYSFLLGVAIFRFRATLQVGRPAYVLVALLLIAGAAMSVPTNGQAGWSGYFDLFVTALFLPILLIVSIGTRLPPWADSLALFLGGISYSVYLWHTPMLVAYSAILKRIPGQTFDKFVPWAGIIFIPLLICASYLTWAFFERPAQKWLRDKFSRGTERRGIA